MGFGKQSPRRFDTTAKPFVRSYPGQRLAAQGRFYRVDPVGGLDFQQFRQSELSLAGDHSLEHRLFMIALEPRLARRIANLDVINELGVERRYVCRIRSRAHDVHGVDQ